MSDHLFNEVSSTDAVNLRSTRAMEELVMTSLATFRRSFIVIDGLDEAATEQAARTVKWLLSLANGGIDAKNTTLRVLLCGQRDGILDRSLADQPSLCLETFPGHCEDILRYCRQVCEDIRKKFDLSPEMAEDIASRVASQASGNISLQIRTSGIHTDESTGMFLYARVVLKNLLNQTKLSRLKQELEPGTFPDGMEKA